MNPKIRRVLAWVFIIVFGSICALGPLIAAFFSVKHKHWFLAGLSIAAWFVMRKILFAVENKVGIRSPQNSEARAHGAGVTIIMPWLRRKIDKADSGKTDGNQ
jgi:hypothetical protein